MVLFLLPQGGDELFCKCSIVVETCEQVQKNNWPGSTYFDRQFFVLGHHFSQRTKSRRPTTHTLTFQALRVCAFVHACVCVHSGFIISGPRLRVQQGLAAVGSLLLNKMQEAKEEECAHAHTHTQSQPTKAVTHDSLRPRKLFCRFHPGDVLCCVVSWCIQWRTYISRPGHQ